MKTSKILMVIALFAALTLPVNSFAKNSSAPKEDVEKLMKWFPKCMESDYKGIVEGTIYNVVLLKKFYPEADYKNLIKDLNKVAEKSDDPAISTKAHLAAMYLSFSNLIIIEPASTGYTPDNVFNQIADQVKDKLLVTN
jgi:hypothetical protein